ncbi:MAG: fibronectin type III domain-containing protein, partial [Candidatus Riflebacteria bacterium]|nr:fibronectin type III domain-containing protein [Candidatus Riflebacteria bacterium]
SATTWPASAPAAPSNLGATAVGGSRVDLVWNDNSADETSFRIERKIGPGGPYGLVAAVPANTTTWCDTGLSPSTTYFYRVLAYNNAGAATAPSEPSARTGAALAPQAPSGLAALSRASSRVDLSWQDNSIVEDGFQIERKTGSDGTYAVVATVPSDTVGFGDTGLSAKTTYTYRVRAYNTAGSSAYTPEVSATAQAASGSGSGGKSGCFIATAAYGSPLDPHVVVLRRFRDRVLVRTPLGRQFVEAYYRHSPPVADLIRRSEALRCVTRWGLAEVIGAVRWIEAEAGSAPRRPAPASAGRSTSK